MLSADQGKVAATDINSSADVLDTGIFISLLVANVRLFTTIITVTLTVTLTHDHCVGKKMGSWWTRQHLPPLRTGGEREDTHSVKAMYNHTWHSTSLCQVTNN
eukprot:scpid109476/ scgid32802/ 